MVVQSTSREALDSYLSKTLPPRPRSGDSRLNTLGSTLVGRLADSISNEIAKRGQQPAANLLLQYQGALERDQHSVCTQRTYLSAVEQMLALQLFPNRFAPIREALEILDIVAAEDVKQCHPDTLAVVKKSRSLLLSLVENNDRPRTRPSTLPDILAQRSKLLGHAQQPEFGVVDEAMPERTQAEISASQTAILKFVFDHFAHHFDREFWEIAMSNPMLGKVKECFIQRGNNKNSINTKFGAIRNFSGFLVNQNLLDQRIDVGLFTIRSRNQLQSESPEVIEDTSVIDAGFQYLDKRVKSLKRSGPTASLFLATRDRSLWALMGLRALRPMSLTQLQISDLKETKKLLAVVEKGPKRSQKPMNGRVFQSISQYLEVREELYGRTKPSDFLFVNRLGHPISEKLVNRLVHCVGEQIGEPSLSPRDLRALCITRLIDEGIPHTVVQELAGHVDLKTTLQNYDRRSQTAKAVSLGQALSNVKWM